MTASIVFTIVQALPKEEQCALLKMVASEVAMNTGEIPVKEKLLTRAEADAFILRTVFKSN